MANKPKSESRPERIPVSGNRDRLSVTGIPKGYVGRVVNDDPQKDPHRIQKFLDGGYEFVTSSGVTIGKQDVHTSELLNDRRTVNVGNGITAYVMAIREEFYKEDFAAKQDIVDRKEKGVYRQFKEGKGQYGDVEIGRK